MPSTWCRIAWGSSADCSTAWRSGSAGWRLRRSALLADQIGIVAVFKLCAWLPALGLLTFLLPRTPWGGQPLPHTQACIRARAGRRFRHSARQHGASRMAELPKEARCVVIGGGIIGCSVAYHLAKLGWRDVVLLERKRLTSGTTWHAAGLIGQLRGSSTLTKLAKYSAEPDDRAGGRDGLVTGFRQNGSLSLALSARAPRGAEAPGHHGQGVGRRGPHGVAGRGARQVSADRSRRP